MQVFLYFVICCRIPAESFINSAKSLPPVGIELSTQDCNAHFLCLQTHTYPTELSWQVLIEGYISDFTCVGAIDLVRGVERI